MIKPYGLTKIRRQLWDPNYVLMEPNPLLTKYFVNVCICLRTPHFHSLAYLFIVNQT